MKFARVIIPIAATVLAGLGGTAIQDATAHAATAVTRPPTCLDELGALRAVSGPRNAGLRVGDNFTQAISDNGPHHWATILRRAGLPTLARTAAGIHNDRTDHDFVLAMAATYDALLTGREHCRHHN